MLRTEIDATDCSDFEGANIIADLDAETPSNLRGALSTAETSALFDGLAQSFVSSTRPLYFGLAASGPIAEHGNV
jgi:hypothetical protein